jgi:hypothetical protein
LATGAFLKPRNRPDPIVGFNLSEVVLLSMHVGSDVLAKQRKERGNGEGFVAVSDELVIDGVLVKVYAQEGSDGIYRDHEQDADDAS